MINVVHKTLLGGVIASSIVFGGGAVIQIDNQINPYDTVIKVVDGKQVETLEITKESSLPEGKEVRDIVSTDEPKITLEKWGGEVALGIKSMDLPPNTTGVRPFLSKNVEWSSGNVKMEAVPIEATTTMEDGGMEINIILNSPPPSNVFSFQLDNWENLDFFYQAPLWQEAGLKTPTKDCTDTDCTTAEGTPHRPDNVVGSYAVYYKDHANHTEGQTNYATGKAYHIFRPLVTDANEATVWADLSYLNGVLIVTVPQSFIDNAGYPVKVDPTFGRTSVGASNSTYGTVTISCNNTNTSISANGSVTDINVYGGRTGGSDVVFRGGVYDTALNLQSPQSSESTITAVGPQWWTISFGGPSVVTSNSYMACVYLNSFDASHIFTYYYDTGVSGDVKHTTSGLTYPTWTNPLVPTNSALNRSLYATYTASSGANTSTVQINGQVQLNGQMKI